MCATVDTGQSNPAEPYSRVVETPLTTATLIPHFPPFTEKRPAPDCGVNPGWRKNNGFCYYYNDTDIVDFHTALRRCLDEAPCWRPSSARRSRPTSTPWYHRFKQCAARETASIGSLLS